MNQELKNKVPFFANTEDGTHCVQACFRMALKYYLPEKEFGWQKLDNLSQKVKGKGTMWFPALLKFEELGISTKFISSFDYLRYYKEGENYLYSCMSEDSANWYQVKSNLPDVKSLIPELIDKTGIEKRKAEFNDIISLIRDGWLVGVDLNAKTLYGREGYSAHMILIFSSDGEQVQFHDPGLPPNPNQLVSKEIFMKAWEYSSKEKTSLVAFRKA